MKSLLTAALLFLAGGAHAAGAGCQDTTGGLVLEKVRAGAVGSQPWGCINRTIDLLSTVAVDTNTFAALSISTAVLSASTESLRVALNLKANLAGATFTGASGITNQSFTATGPNGLIVSGSSVNASAFFGSGAGLTNVPNTSPCAVGAGTNSLLCQGVSNAASGLRSTASGGASNIAGGEHSVVAGGLSNSAGANYGVVSGGFTNVANGVNATITGGGNNTASGDYSTAVGGTFNAATANYALAAGRRAKAAHIGAFVWADSTNSDYASTIADSFNVRAAGGGFFSAHLNVTNSSVNASGFFGNGRGLTNLEPGNLAAGTAGISITGSASLNVLKAGDTMTGTLTIPDLTLSTIGNKIRFDNPRRAIFVDPAGANPVTITNHAAAGKIVQFSLDYDDSNADAGMAAIAYVDASGVVSNYGVSAATGTYSGAVRVIGELRGGANSTSGLMQIGAGPDGFDGARMNMCGSANAVCGGTGAMQYFTKGNSTADHIWYTDQSGGAAEKMRLTAPGSLSVAQGVTASSVTSQGAFAVGGNISLKGSATQIFPDTADGSDNDYIQIGGGGAESSARGGHINLWGNEAGLPGGIQFNAGVLGNIIWSTDQSGGLTEKMRLTSAGLLGIGIAAPASKLHMSSGTLTVDGNQSGDVLTVRSNLSNADLHFLLETTGTGGSESSRIDLKTTNRHWLIQNAKGLSNGFAIRDETAGSATRLFIDDGGRVGVGTTSLEAANKIQVQAATGNVVVASSTTASGFGVFSAHGTAGGCIMLTDTDNAGWTKCKALNGTLTCAIDADGICD